MEYKNSKQTELTMTNFAMMYFILTKIYLEYVYLCPYYLRENVCVRASLDKTGGPPVKIQTIHKTPKQHDLTTTPTTACVGLTGFHMGQKIFHHA
jgi:hypothetical protein